MPTVKLTNPFVRNAPRPTSGRVEYWDALTPGLGLRVSANGAASWVALYRANGKLRRMTIGKLARYTLAEAREAGAIALKSAGRGEDPALEKRLARRAGLEVSSVADVLRAYHARYAVRELTPRVAGETKRIIDRDLAPTLGGYPAAELRKAIVAEHLDTIAEEAPMSARNAFKVLRAAYRWAAGERGILDANPIAGLGAPIKDVRRDRVLADDEIRLLSSVWNAERDPFFEAAKLMLLTAQRVQEVAQIRWSEIDLEAKTWMIAPARHKTRTGHLVPLSDAALAVIKAQPRFAGCDFVFTTGRPSEDGTASALNGWSKAKVRMDAAASEILRKPALKAGASKEEAAKISIASWRFQDLRRTARTLMSRAGVPFDHAERVLGHVIAGVAGVYDRHAYVDEKRSALEKLAELVTAIVAAPSGNVTSLAKKRAERASKKTAAGGTG